MAIGIDLGTTHSLIAYIDDNARPALIPNSENSTLTPSVVGVDDDGSILVGNAAKERLITHPHLTAACFKRRMGTDFVYKLGNHKFRPEELSSLVLKSLKADAEHHLSTTIEEVVISVPAYFNASQRRATETAASLAGLKVINLISEPTAAAIAYGIQNANSAEKFLVLDLGGGTFDVTLLELFEGVIEVRASGGDNFLGGEDFVTVLATHALAHHNTFIHDLSIRDQQIILRAVERVKRELSSSKNVLLKANLEKFNIEQTITRDEFESLCKPLIERLERPIARVFRDSQISPLEVSQIVLVGGATRMPLIRDLVVALFKKFPNIGLSPDEAIAEGAAIQAALARKHQAFKEVAFTDVTPYTLGIEISEQIAPGRFVGGQFLPIIERNTIVPASKVVPVAPAQDYQTKVCFKIYQGEGRSVEQNIKLGEFEVKLPRAKAGEQIIDIRFTVDKSGLLEAEATVLSTSTKNSLVIERSPGMMSEKEIQEALSKLNQLKIHPRDKMENRALIARAERLYEEALGELRSSIGDALRCFESIIDTQNEKHISQARRDLTHQLDSFESFLRL